MKKLLLMTLVMGFVFGAAAQNGKPIKQRKSNREIVMQAMGARDYVPENQTFRQQTDSIVMSDESSLNCYKYELDYLGRVHSEILYQKVDENGGAEPVEKKIYDYETSEACPNITGYYWQNSEWIEGWKEVYTFDKNGDAVLWQQFDRQDMGGSIQWNVTYYHEMTYDENHNVITNISYAFDVRGLTDYFNEGKEVYEYDENNFVSAMEFYYFDSYETNDWKFSSRTVYDREDLNDSATKVAVR